MGIRGAEGELLVVFELGWEKVWLMYLCPSNNTKIPMNMSCLDSGNKKLIPKN